MTNGMHRIVIFAQPTVGFVPPLLDAILQDLKSRKDVEWVKVCATAEDVSRLRLGGRSLLSFSLKALFNLQMAANFDLPRITTVSSVAKKHGVEIIKPPNYKINDPEFIRRLAADHAPTLALSLACLQIWGAKLLGTFDCAVNFHNGYLPDYKGLWATEWSVYQGENFSGYAFHVMDEKIDTGPIISRGRVPIGDQDRPSLVERRKIRAACTDAKKIWDAILSKDFDSSFQPKGGSYFSGKAASQIRTIDDPSTLTAQELIHRLRCFATLKIKIDGVQYPVTSLRLAKHRKHKLSFVTNDGVELFPDRLRYVPTGHFTAARQLPILRELVSGKQILTQKSAPKS